jgi:hypothetical protein
VVASGSRCMGSRADLRPSGSAGSSLASARTSPSHRWRDGALPLLPLTRAERCVARRSPCLCFPWEDRFPRGGKAQVVERFYENRKPPRFPRQARMRGTSTAISAAPPSGEENPSHISDRPAAWSISYIKRIDCQEGVFNRRGPSACPRPAGSRSGRRRLGPANFPQGRLGARAANGRELGRHVDAVVSGRLADSCPSPGSARRDRCAARAGASRDRRRAAAPWR